MELTQLQRDVLTMQLTDDITNSKQAFVHYLQEAHDQGVKIGANIYDFIDRILGIAIEKEPLLYWVMQDHSETLQTATTPPFEIQDDEIVLTKEDKNDIMKRFDKLEDRIIDLERKKTKIEDIVINCQPSDGNVYNIPGIDGNVYNIPGINGTFCKVSGIVEHPVGDTKVYHLPLCTFD